MSPQAEPTMPSIQGEAMELFSRVPPLALNSGRGGGSRGSHLESPAGSAAASIRASGGRRPSTSAGGRQSGGGGMMISQAGLTGAGGKEETKAGPASRGATGSGGSEDTEDSNQTKSRLLGGYLRDHLLANITSPEPAKEHLHRGHGHVLTLDEFKEGLSNTFGAPIPLQLIQATFDIFDTEPRTWQLDFDEFCHWLETGERALNSHGIMKKTVKAADPAANGEPQKARKLRSNDTSGEFKSSVSDSKGGGMSMEQADRAQLKAHLMKHRSRLHRANGLTEAQKSIVDHILMDQIKARQKVASMLPHLHEECEIKEAFSRMDHNGDGVVDLTDFLMWEERMQEGRANTDFWALQEENHLEQIKLARSKASNLLVPDDYDGSTYHAKLSRELAEVKGGSLEMLRAFRHFRPAAVGRRLFMDYREFRESIKQKGLGLSEADIKTLFGYFDVDGSGEIDFSEFRRFLRGGTQQTGLPMGVDRHKEKTVAARSRVAALEKTTTLDPALAGDARSDQLLKAKVLRRITGGQAEVLRALRGFGADGGKYNSEMDYPCFASAIGKAGFNLSEPETRQVFNEFRLEGPSGEQNNGVPTGEMSAQAFREWLLESHTSTGLDVGEVDHLRAKVVASFTSDHRNLLRAFRGVTRKKGSRITAADFREALSSFGLPDDKASADRLFQRYDWRQRGSELMETITRSESLPGRLTSSQRQRRLEEERRLPDEAVKKAERAIRRGLWSRHLDNTEGCFLALTGGKGGVMGLEGLTTAVHIAGVKGEAAEDVTLKQVLQKYAPTSGSGGQGHGWSLQDFAKFYRPDDCRKAMALARERDGDKRTEEDMKKAELIAEGNKARTKLLKQVRRLAQALTAADKGKQILRTGRVSRKTFAKALAKEGGLGRVGEAELTRLLMRHGCAEQGGSYVNYPVFVASFTAAVRGADPAAAVAAAAAGNATSGATAAATSADKSSSKAASGTACAWTAAARWAQGSVEPLRESASANLDKRPGTPYMATASPSPMNDHRHPPNRSGSASTGRAQTADGGSRSRRTATKAHSPTHQGYFKRFTAAGGDIDTNSLMKVSKSAPALPDLVGQRPEVPKTTPIHRVMKRDVTRSAKELRKAFKQCENPYRRGVAVCLKNGVTVDMEDIDFLLRLHQHKPSMGGKYAIPPKWAQSPSPGVDPSGASRDTSKTFQQRAATTPGSVQQQDTASVDANQVVEAQRLRIVLMLLQGETYGLPGSDGTLAFDGGMFILVYLAGVAKSWFYWPILAGAMFLWKFKRAKSRFEEKHPGQLALAWPIDSHDTDDVEIKMGADGKPIVYQSPTRSPRSQEGDGRDPRTVAAITSQPGSPQMTPEITPHYPQQYNSSGGYSLPPHKPQHQQQYNGPPSPAHRVPAAMETQPQSPRLPAENPYCLSHLNNGESAVKVGQMSRSPSNGGRIPTEMSPVNAGYAPVNSQGHGGQPGGNPPVAVHHGGVLSVPPGWEVKVLPEGRTMFVDHNTQTTHWEPPVMHAPPLPPPSLPPSYHQHQAAMQRSPPSSPPSYHVHHASHGH
eukprot:g5716.t1